MACNNNENNGSSQFDAAAGEYIRKALYKPEFDRGLGQEAANDAMRVSAGEMTEDQFYQKYHQAYLKEFGVDLRPVKLSGVSDAERITSSLLESPITRRNVLKFAGAGAAALAISFWLGDRTLAKMREDIPRPTPVQYGMVIDQPKCDGCLACVAACKAHNALDEGVYWLHLISYTDTNTDGVNVLPRFCNHCSNAPCVKVCPVGARFKRESDGMVLIDYDRCIGCRFCMAACPYGVNYFMWEDPHYPLNINPMAQGRRVAGRPPAKGIMSKCDFCPEHHENPAQKGTTMCQITCPKGVIQFGDLNDPQSVPMKYLAKKKSEGYISTFRLGERFGTKPNIIYIGQQPSANAKLAPLPTPYETMGWVSKREHVLQGPEPWFNKLLGIEQNGSSH